MAKTTGIIISIIIVVILIIIAVSSQRGKDSGVIEETPVQEGLGIEVLQEGSGLGAQNNYTISVHYTGMLEDGTIFDSSLDRGVPFSFTLGIGQVISGWDKGVLGMKIGEKRKLTISPELAYGEAGIPGAIPPNSTLIFDIEMLEISVNNE